ncbi:MAG TPA: hypothetical protein VK846_03095 [Candidatus Limnocylindria bacterium]|nr:hypothetical protein [Candidatus Limnocylindria bacterium]
MKSRSRVFNGFLVLLALALASGCATSEERKRKKEFSTLRIHVESDQQSDHSSAISIIRSAPILLNIDREPVLMENNVLAALVVEQPGGFGVEIKFDRQGTWILERTTVVSRGKRLAIFSDFGQARWLAAPLITSRNQSGTLRFTSDCTREEAERFVRGLNNTVHKAERRENWPFPGPWEK